jgi:hypothetical protein
MIDAGFPSMIDKTLPQILEFPGVRLDWGCNG